MQKLRLPLEEGEISKPNEAAERRNRIAARAAMELRQGYYVNLGVGIPTMAPNFLDKATKVGCRVRMAF